MIDLRVNLHSTALSYRGVASRKGLNRPPSADHPSFFGRMIFMPKLYPRQLRERAIRSVAAELGVAMRESPRRWIRHV